MADENYLVVVKGAEDGPGRVIAMATATSCAEAVKIFRSAREVPELERGVRIDALAARIVPGEPDRFRTWKQVRPGLWLYSPDVTSVKIRSYARDRLSRG